MWSSRLCSVGNGSVAPSPQYWRLYVPIFSFHMMCAVSTIGLGVYNLYMGLTRLRQGTGMGAMVAGVSSPSSTRALVGMDVFRHDTTAYLVYLMLFVWFPSS